MSVPLLTTRFYVPRARANGVLRPRLTEKLLAGVNRPGSFALLSDPAGFGKVIFCVLNSKIRGFT